MSNESETLERAKQLIIAKDYNQARHVLQSIHHHPTAQQWLAKLDQIAPKPANSGEEAFLQHAKQLILKKQYDQAREILEQYPKNPTARQWLIKLDQIAPQRPTFASDDLFPTIDPQPPGKTDLPKPKKPVPTLNPWNPSTGFMFLFFFSPAALFFFPLNWRRLGKPEWAMETFLIGILTFGAIIASVLIVAINLGSDSKLGIVLIVGALAANIGFWIAVGTLQEGAYKTWTKTRDPIALINHPYNFMKAGLVVLAFAGIAVVTVVVLVFLNQRTTTYDGDLLTLEYRNADWNSHEPSELEFCQTQIEGCLFVLGDKPYGNTVIVITTYDFNQTFGIEALDVAWWQQAAAEYPYDIVVDVYETTEIDGVAGYVREFSAPEDGVDYYYRITNLIHGSQFVQIQAWSSSHEDFEEDREEIMEVIESIDFK